MRRIMLLIVLVLSCLLPFSAAAEGTVPKAADTMAMEMDAQLMKRIGTHPDGRNGVSIAITVPVSLGNLQQTSPLARQMTEEMMRWLVNAGYHVDEIRKGNDIVMIPQKGEMILTRQRSQLAQSSVRTAAVLAGTYTITEDSVRFNMRLLHTPSNQVLAMATATVPVTSEVYPLLADSSKSRYPMPSVFTRLP